MSVDITAGEEELMHVVRPEVQKPIVELPKAPPAPPVAKTSETSKKKRSRAPSVITRLAEKFNVSVRDFIKKVGAYAMHQASQKYQEQLRAHGLMDEYLRYKAAVQEFRGKSKPNWRQISRESLREVWGKVRAIAEKVASGQELSPDETAFINTILNVQIKPKAKRK